MTLKTLAAAAAALASVAAWPGAAVSQTRDNPPTWHSGTPVNVFADPSDFVVELDTAGRCGSKYFHVLRSAANFDEMVAVVLTAFATGKQLTFIVPSRVSVGPDNRMHDAYCRNLGGTGSGDRNIVSHGFVSR